MSKLTKETEKKSKSLVQGVFGLVRGLLHNFGQWLKPNPADHWLLQILKSIGKLPLVLLLIVCSPILLVVFLIVFLIAL